MRAGKSGADYPTAVVDTLAAEFPNLTDPATAAIVRDAVARQADQPNTAFECIVDSPLLANWRLRAHREAPPRVRLTCCRLDPPQADHDREQRVNQALDRLSSAGPTNESEK
jgi:hypothetical protein